MALDYYNVIPHKVTLLGGHFTPGRDSIKGLVRHHTAGVLNAAQLNRIWRPNGGRQASTNYLTDVSGVVSQHVWDNDSAWANAHAWANRNYLSMEHSNNAGGPDWPIADATIIGGARWGAALANFYKWGRPEFNKNIFDHRKFTATSCPHHLHAYAGRYNDEWFEESTWFFDQLEKKLVDGQGNPIKHNFPAPTPAPTPEEGFMSALTPDEQRELLTKTRELHNAFLAPVPSTVPGSTYEAPRVTFLDHMDRKIEDLHVQHGGTESPTQAAMDVQARTISSHRLTDEDHHDGGEVSDA